MSPILDSKIIRREDYVYPCPVRDIWNDSERQDIARRRCYVCAQECQKVVHRVFYATEVRNFCSIECFESE